MKEIILRKKWCRHKSGRLLLFMIMFAGSCNGQIEKNTAIDSNSASKTVTGKQTKIIRTQDSAAGNIGAGLQDKAGHLWFITSGEGVYRYDGGYFTQFTKKDGLSDNDVNALIEDKAGNILFATNRGVCRYDGEYFTPLTANDDVSKKPISSLLEDRKGNLWLGTMESGIYCYDGKSFTNYLNNDDYPFHLGVHHQAIIDMLQDKMGHIWFSSWNRGGVWRYDGKSFTNYLPNADYYRSKDSISNDENPFTHYLSQITTTTNRSRDSITDDMIFSISEDKAGNLWFATRRHGACRYDGRSFTSFTEQNGFANKGMYAILEDKNGNLWFTTEKDGVWRYDGKTFAHYTMDNGLHDNSVFSIIEDQNGNLWFGTRGFGLSRYDGKTFTSFSEP